MVKNPVSRYYLYGRGSIYDPSDRLRNFFHFTFRVGIETQISNVLSKPDVSYDHDSSFTMIHKGFFDRDVTKVERKDSKRCNRSCRSKVEIIKIYYRNSESVASKLRALSLIYICNNRSSRLKIERLVGKFESTGTVQKIPVPVRQRSARSVENIAAAEASVEENPNVSSHMSDTRTEAA